LSGVLDAEAPKFALVQPSVRRREWQLRSGDDVKAVLRLPALRSGGRAEVAGRPLRIERHGSLRAEYAVRDETTGEEVARLRRDGRRSVLELDGRQAEWKRLGRKEGYGFVGADGAPLVRARVSSGLLRATGEVQLDPALDEQAAVVAALLASYLLIRKHEEEATAAAGATTAATGP
jgi:hypothetical protein